MSPCRFSMVIGSRQSHVMLSYPCALHTGFFTKSLQESSYKYHPIDPSISHHKTHKTISSSSLAVHILYFHSWRWHRSWHFLTCLQGFGSNRRTSSSSSTTCRGVPLRSHALLPTSPISTFTTSTRGSFQVLYMYFNLHEPRYMYSVLYW